MDKKFFVDRDGKKIYISECGNYKVEINTDEEPFPPGEDEFWNDIDFYVRKK